MLQKDHVQKEQEDAANRGEGNGAASQRTTGNRESEAVGATDVMLAPIFARASTASAKMQVQVGVPDFPLVASFVGTSTRTGAPIRSSAVGVPVFLLVPISAGTSTSPKVLGEEEQERLWTPCVARFLLPSTPVTTHDDPATGGAGVMRG